MSAGRKSPEKLAPKISPQSARGSRGTVVIVEKDREDGNQTDDEDDDDASSPMKLEDQLTYHKLKELESIFEVGLMYIHVSRIYGLRSIEI